MWEWPTGQHLFVSQVYVNLLTKLKLHFVFFLLPPSYCIVLLETGQTYTESGKSTHTTEQLMFKNSKVTWKNTRLEAFTARIREIFV